MRRLGPLALVLGLLVVASGSARAQEESSGDQTAASTSGAEGAEGAEAAKGGETEAQAYATAEGTFPIRRGFFVEGDFGVFFAIGGRNTNAIVQLPEQPIPARSTSNVEPMLGLTVGYDVASSPSFNLALGLRGALMLNGGSGRVPEEDARGLNGEDPRTQSNDFSIYEVGLAAQADFYFTDRLSLATKLDGGLAILNPDPSLPGASTGRDAIQGAGGPGVGGMGSLAFGINYATLLTGFQIGLDVRFTAIFFDGLIPALSATVPIKYNF